MRQHLRRNWLYSSRFQSPSNVEHDFSCPLGLNKQGVSGLPVKEGNHMPTISATEALFFVLPLKFWGLKWPTCEGGQSWR
ncbi:hypothetical protein [Trueperella pecoris]|uniref:Uncharacterized protein n=1 Tax=Trueperella pecoris TaxID=2733571 RepID=A0A7M1QS38_9ACTO|nr:hypothetical protein [Trueperella pecoris]QOR44972.1 hypothetical protein INS88_06680 [Trueperella pecoris]